MATGAGKKAGNFFVWIIMGLLIVGLMGFGASGLSGNIRSIGSVGDKPISVQAYFNAVNQEIQSAQQQAGRVISFPEAQAAGLPQAALGRLVAQRAIDDEAATLGLSVGDTRVREQVLQIPSFRGVSGAFDREAYRFALSQGGQSETEFEDGIREDAARSLLQAAIITGFDLPSTYSDALLTYFGEERSFTWARMDQDDLITPLPTPTATQLTAYFDANPAAFTLPETKRLTYVWLTPDMILDQVVVDETSLKDLYEERRDEYIQAERRLVERLVFGDDSAAENAKASVERGETTFEGLVEARGLTLSDVDMGDVAQSDLGDAGDAVFNADAPALVGPFTTNLGPALFRINAVLAAQEVSFDEAREALQNELAQDRARRIIDGMIADIEDQMAAGATLEELGADTDMRLATLDWFPAIDGDIAAYSEFRTAARQAQDSDFPEIAGLDDGGIFALRLDEVVAPRVQPQADVAADVIAGWTAQETTTALSALVERLQPQIEGGMDLATLGLTARIEDAITRGGFIPDTPPSFLTAVFEMSAGDVRVVEDTGAIFVLRLAAVAKADLTSTRNLLLASQLAQQVSTDLAQDVFDAYARGIQAKAGLSLNQSAINSVHANFQQ